MSSAPFSIEGVTRRFGGFTAVDDVTLELGGPGITALIGANGAGKTTLFNLITGQLTPTEGSVRLDGVDCTGHSPQQMARLGIGRSFQDVRLFDDLSVRENVIVYAQDPITASMTATFARPLRQRAASRRARAKADELLDYLGIAALRAHRADSLGFAQQKLVGIARLLALEPRILFLDEPASGLDHVGRETLAEAMRRLHDDGLAVCFVEHNTHLVRELATRVLFLSQGRIAADGTPDEVFSDSTLAEAYLGLA